MWTLRMLEFLTGANCQTPFRKPGLRSISKPKQRHKMCSIALVSPALPQMLPNEDVSMSYRPIIAHIAHCTVNKFRSRTIESSSK